jgi:hypothetical protein
LGKSGKRAIVGRVEMWRERRRRDDATMVVLVDFRHGPDQL